MKCIDIVLAEPADGAVTLEDVVIDINTARKAIIEAIAGMTEKEAENSKELITDDG